MSLEELNRKRATVKSRLTSFQSFLRKLESEPTKCRELPVRLERAEKLLAEHEEIQSQIEIITKEIDHDERTKFEDTYYTVIALGRQTNSLSQQLTPRTAPLAADITAHTNSLLKLPNIDLPTFNGEYDQWITFRDTFEAIIDTNTNLTKIQKFHYLQSAVKGRASQCFQSLSLSNDTYDAAWNLLKSRFENKQLIVHHHIQAILDLPVLSKESASNLRKLIDDVRQHLCALTKLSQPVQTWDTLLIHLITPKLDAKTKREWEFKRDFTTLPTMNEFMEFLNKRCSILEILVSSNKPKDNSLPDLKSHKKSVSLTAQSAGDKQCPLCKNHHWLYACPSFRKLSSQERLQEAKRLKVCLNCLRLHADRECTFGGCQRCKRRHNTMLHVDHNNSSHVTATNSSECESSIKIADDLSSPQTNVTTSHCATRGVTQALLSTAVILVSDKNGQYQECKALLDSASQSHFMTKDLCQRLQLTTCKTNHLINGIGQTNVTINNRVTSKIRSKYNNYYAEISCYIVDSITGLLPPNRIDPRQFKIPENIRLADPNYNVPAKIDLLIGVTLFYDLLQEKRIRLGNNQPILQETKLGWIIGGTFTPGKSSTQCKASQCYVSLNTQIQEQLERFWQLEEVKQSRLYTKEEQTCENHFVSTHQRNQDGRFIVQLPLKGNISELGDSREIAERRLCAIERKLDKNATLKNAYSKFLQEYKDLGHMSEVEEHEENDEHANYLPHHAVTKSTSTTTKVRVVFDASCKTSTGKSLNDLLLVGPTIQNTLFHIVTRFRQHTYVVTADINKMYRQVLLQQSQRDLQRIVWRSPSGKLQSFRLNTITYGLTSAPFSAIRCLCQLAEEHKITFPQANQVILRDFYVDDLISGDKDKEQLKVLIRDITKILQSGGFELHKWNSNDVSILNDNDNEATESVSFDQEVNTLGLIWNTQSDTFQYRVNLEAPTSRITKRIILSVISRIFDPLGLIGPTVIQSKSLLQDVWALKIGWDDAIPTELQVKWSYFRDQLQCISNISIPRHAFGKNHNKMEIHGFCDASEMAYGACIYIKTTNEFKAVTVNLLCAKSRVAPLKNISLPRLELCAALLLSQLYQQVMQSLTISAGATYLWSDSTITLAWIRGEPSRWVPFVANRVTEIQQLTGQAKWNHVNSKDNPADIISRGMYPSQLKTCHLWWDGPEWLKTKDWPLNDEEIKINENLLEERRSTKTFHIQTNADNELFLRYSSLSKLKRIIAYCLRFKESTLHPESRITGSLTVTELERAMMILVSLAQQHEFADDMQSLKSYGQVSKTSNLRSLLPFLDMRGLIRVGDRLSNAPIPYAQKHPLILPPRHPLTRLIILNEHYKHLHAGPQALLAAIRTQFWPIRAQCLVKDVLRKCIICFRSKPPILQQRDLPTARTTTSRPFLNVGIDYGGPFIIKISRNKTAKAYICIFVCFTTRAVHIELVVDLSTSAFIRTLQRFIARRGKCAQIYSDNATNFVGANNELKKIAELLRDPTHHAKISDFLAENSIKWTFIPPHSPHMGGLWEAAIKSAKTHLRRVVGTTPLTYEELYTLLVQIEACLNSRPLCAMSNDATDLNVLTPGHFLIGVPLTSLPETDVTDVAVNRLTRHQLLTQMRQHFWKRWSTEYLTQLQQRVKWTHPSNADIRVNALVLLRDDNAPPLQWRLGRIIAVHPGRDGLIRIVDVKTMNGIVQRSLPKLCILPIDT